MGRHGRKGNELPRKGCRYRRSSSRRRVGERSCPGCRRRCAAMDAAPLALWSRRGERRQVSRGEVAPIVFFFAGVGQFDPNWSGGGPYCGRPRRMRANSLLYLDSLQTDVSVRIQTAELATGQYQIQFEASIQTSKYTQQGGVKFATHNRVGCWRTTG